MISYEYSKETSYNYGPNGGVNDVCTVMLTGADFLAKAPMNQHNAARAYIIDWYELDSSTQSQIGSQILMFDKENKRWRRQGTV